MTDPAGTPCSLCGVPVADADATRLLGKVVCPAHAAAAVTLAEDANRLLEHWGLADALTRGRDLWDGLRQIGKALEGPPARTPTPPPDAPATAGPADAADRRSARGR